MGVAIRRVRFRKSGGFAGLVRGSEIAGDQLRSADRRAVERQVKAVRTAPPADSGARDLVVYELQLETDTGVVRLESDEAGAPEDLVAFVDDLASRARPMAP